MTSDQKTCEERIDGHLQGRVLTFAALSELARYSTGDKLSQEALDILGEPGIELPEHAADEDTIIETGQERAWELPLAVTRQRVDRIDLSTGGPGDWIEVWRDEDGGYGRIVYHFNDWFDHAERTLDGPEYDATRAFAESVLPE